MCECIAHFVQCVVNREIWDTIMWLCVLECRHCVMVMPWFIAASPSCITVAKVLIHETSGCQGLPALELCSLSPASDGAWQSLFSGESKKPFTCHSLGNSATNYAAASFLTLMLPRMLLHTATKAITADYVCLSPFTISRPNTLPAAFCNRARSVFSGATRRQSGTAAGQAAAGNRRLCHSCAAAAGT